MAVKRKISEVYRDPSDLDGFIGYNLKRAYVIVEADFRRALGKDGLTPRGFSALTLVSQHPNVTQSELARMLGIERSGLVAIVDDLESRGYVERKTVLSDRRVHALRVTDIGQITLAELNHRVRSHEDDLFSVLSEDERRILITLLGKIRMIER